MQTSILITGCSSGIGHAAAIALRSRGYRVFAGARRPADVQKLLDEGFESILLDLNDSTSIRHAIENILKATGGTLDAVFNNAAFLVAGATEDLSRDLVRRQFETNVFGTMELTQLLLPIMRQQGHGRIVQNSSILGVVALPYYGAYNASKFALEGFSDTLRQELRGTNIHVSIINPGPIKSELRATAHRVFTESVAQHTSGAHQKAYDKLATSYFHPDAKSKRIMLTPDAVIQKLIHALESPRPQVHYFIGWPAKLLAFAKRILPDKQLDWLLTKI